jgi:hypothetical protein
MDSQETNHGVIHYGGNRADRRKQAHKSKPFAAIEAKRTLSHERNTAKRASAKLNRGNQFGGMTQGVAQPKREHYAAFIIQENFGDSSLRAA